MAGTMPHAIFIETAVDGRGLVAAYAVWRRTAVARGPEDTEPLDTPH